MTGKILKMSFSIKERIPKASPFVSDYSENAYREKMCTLVDPDYDFAVRIVMDSDFMS